MTGLRGLRQEIKAIRDELGGSQRYERFITMQSGVNTHQAVVDAFLDRELGGARDRCVVVNLQQFCHEHAPPRILSNVPYRGR